jgi:hypothetical protein
MQDTTGHRVQLDTILGIIRIRDRLEDTLKLRKIPYLNLMHAVAHTLAHTLSPAHKVSPI